MSIFSPIPGKKGQIFIKKRKNEGVAKYTLKCSSKHHMSLHANILYVFKAYSISPFFKISFFEECYLKN